MSEHRQEERDGLPTARFSDADQVAARHDRRNGLCLDRGGLLVFVPCKKDLELKSVDEQWALCGLCVLFFPHR